MAKLGRGERARVPPRLGYHLVAARYGTTPELVRETWPADDYLDALAFAGVTGLIVGGKGS